MLLMMRVMELRFPSPPIRIHLLPPGYGSSLTEGQRSSVGGEGGKKTYISSKSFSKSKLLTYNLGVHVDISPFTGDMLIGNSPSKETKAKGLKSLNTPYFLLFWKDLLTTGILAVSFSLCFLLCIPLGELQEGNEIKRVKLKGDKAVN